MKISPLLQEPAADLCEADLVVTDRFGQLRYRQQGRKVYYTLDDDPIRILLDVARQHVTHR